MVKWLRRYGPHRRRAVQADQLAVFDREQRIISTYDPGPGGLTRTVHTQDRPMFVHRLRRRDDPFPIVVEVPKVRSWQTLLSQNERHAGRELIWNAKTPALLGLSREEALDLAEILRRYAEEIPEVHRGT